MIPQLCVLAVAIAVSAAIPAADRCVVGPWTTWSDWQSTRRCVSSAELETYSMDASDAWDTGRAKMAQIMQMKKQRFEERQACKERGDCPAAWAFRPSSGETKCVAGSADDIPCLNVDQEYFINFNDMGVTTNPEGNDVWGWTDPLTGDEYAIMCLTSATTFVRVTDPKNPVPVGVLNTATTSSVWRDAKVIGNYAYIVSEASRHGLQVFDLTRLRGRNSAEVLEPDAVHTGFGNAHNIVANEDTNFVYVVGATQTGYPQTCRDFSAFSEFSCLMSSTMVGSAERVRKKAVLSLSNRSPSKSQNLSTCSVSLKSVCICESGDQSVVQDNCKGGFTATYASRSLRQSRACIRP